MTKKEIDKAGIPFKKTHTVLATVRITATAVTERTILIFLYYYYYNVTIII